MSTVADIAQNPIVKVVFMATVMVLLLTIFMTVVFKDHFDPNVFGARREITSNPLKGITAGSSLGLASQRTHTGAEYGSLSYSPYSDMSLYREGMTGGRGDYDYNQPVGESDILSGGQPGIMYSPLYSPVTERDKTDISLWAWDQSNPAPIVPPPAVTPVSLPDVPVTTQVTGEAFYDPLYPYYPPNYTGERRYLPRAGWSVTDDVLVGKMQGR